MSLPRQPPSATTAWVHAAACVPSIGLLRDIGAPVDRELERHKLPLHPLDPLRDIVPRDPFLAFCAGMARSEGLPGLGFEAEVWARRRNPPYAPAGAPTLYRALATATEKAKQHTTLDFFLTETERAVAFCRPVDPVSEAHDTYAGSFALQTLLTLTRRYTGQWWTPPRIGVPLRLTAQRWFRSQWPGTELVPSGNVWWLEVPRSDVARPPIASSADAMVASAIPTIRDDGEFVEHIVRSYLPSTTPTLQVVAEVAGFSPRTLKRRLHAVDRRFSDILQECRLARARHLLETTDQPITEIAFDVGYETPSNFTRAFRSAAGLTPRQFRTSLAQ